MVWTVLFSPKAKKDLQGLPFEIKQKTILKLEEMILENPYVCLDRMANSPFYKFRVGPYRGIVTIVNDKLIIHVFKIEHRSQVYKK